MASPNVAGTLLLLQQHYSNLNGNLMRAASLKGLALHTADDAGISGPDAVFGWGLMNAKRAAETLSTAGTGESMVEELTLNSGDTYSITVASDGTNPLLASISWTDIAGREVTATNSNTPVLVNDLDIRVSKGSTTFEPYRLTGVNSNGTGDNRVDPFERIDVGNASGTYTITVTHKGSLSSGSQNYTLIVTGINGTPGNPTPTPTPTPTDCASTVTSFPYGESFEGSIGDWTQATGDDLDFTVNSGGTPSNSTGPNEAIDGNSYIYVEASGDGTGFPNKTAILNSPCLDFGNVSDPILTFNYHMLGSAINSLTVEARVDNEGSWATVFSETGAQGSDWNAADVDLSAYAGEESVQLRIIVVTGSGNEGWQSDIAIDNVAIGNDTVDPDPDPDPNPDPDGCDSLDFNSFTVSPFSNQDSVGTFSIVSGGEGLSLENNTWKFIALDYTVTQNTVLEFDFSSSAQGEIHAVGFESDNELSDNLYFKVHGTQNYGVTNFDDYASGTKNYVIPVGSFYTGNADRLVFINDNDAGSGNNSIFTNVKIYEGSCGNLAPAIASTGAKVVSVLGDTFEGLPSNGAISVIPNYTSDRFAITVRGDFSDSMYATIYSMLGRKIARVKLENGENQFSAQNLSMQTGMYLIKVFGATENEVIERVIVK